MARKPDLGAGELEVLKVLWTRGPSSVREVLDELHDSGRQLAYNTVQTVLGRLVDKGFATRSARGRGHTYRSRVSREQFGRRRLQDLLFGVHDGRAGSLVMQLVKTGSLQDDEVRELRELLDGLERESKRPPRRGGKAS